MSDLLFINDPAVLQSELTRLNQLKEGSKLKAKRSRAPTALEKEEIYKKTDGRCHVCGELLALEDMQADHVKNPSSGGASAVENYLPACSICNGYRWHYLPHELQWILKLSIWAKAQIVEETTVGKSIAAKFRVHEKHRERRRKHPRLPLNKSAIESEES